MENKKNLNGWAIGINLFNWIVDNIPSESKILELGSGTGTSELGKIFDVHCVENDPAWANKFDNLTYHFAPIKNGWYDKECLKNIPKDYSLLIVDGPKGTEHRSKFIKNLDLFNLDVPIVIDDTHRKAELDLSRKLRERFNKSFIEVKEHDKSAHILT